MQEARTPHESTKSLPMKLSSTAFQHGERMSARHTADGADLSPPLTWSQPPSGTRSLALVCDAPDSGDANFVQWLVWNISPERRGLEEGISSTSGEGGLQQGQNAFGTHGYAGPNPAPGPVQQYRFRLYALDTELALPLGATRGELEAAMAGHILGEGPLIGKYGRSAS